MEHMVTTSALAPADRSVVASSMPSTNWREVVGADEEERFARHAQALRAIQSASARGGAASRALHAKGHVGVRATLELSEALPDHARHGLLAGPSRYQGWARFSNGSPAHQSDRRGDVRGLAVKLEGVVGPKIFGGDAGPQTQDLLAIQSSATPFRDPDEFVAFVKAASRPATLPFSLARAIGIGRTFTILKKLAGGDSTKPVATLAGTTFFSALPIKLGPHAVRYSFAARQAASDPVPADRPDGYLGADLARRLREGPLAWDLRLQFFEDEATTPIEDASVDWTTPWITVGRLELPAQDVASDEGRAIAERVERMSFDPWHALVDHRPLGAMMRARKHAYYESTQGRSATPDAP